MSSRVIVNTSYVSAGDMSSDVTGATFTADHHDTVSAICTVSSASSLVGNIYLQVSNDDSTWVNSSATAALSADGSTLLTLTNFGYKYVRVFWDSTSGSGTLNASICAKGS